MVLCLIGLALVCYGILYAIFLYVLDCDVELAFYEKFGKPISRLRGKVVFITGASSGIGENTAIALAKHGVKLVLAARRKGELERVKQNCIACSNGKLAENDVLVLPMDMLDFDSHAKNFNVALQHFGRIDVLLNNAGRSQRANWENIDMKVHRDMFDLNVFSVLSLSSIAVKYFNTVGSGHIAVTSSVTGVLPLPFSATYIGSKHALHGYFNSLRNEKLTTDLRLAVTLLCPGPTFTNFLQESYTDTVGEKYGIPTQSTDRRMTGERCGELCAIAIANETHESWMGLFPMMPLLYLFVYFPVISKIIMKMVGPNNIFRFRDSKNIDLSEKQQS